MPPCYRFRYALLFYPRDCVPTRKLLISLQFFGMADGVADQNGDLSC
jgi:hypothetical protein